MFGHYLMRLADYTSRDWRKDMIAHIGAVRSLSDKTCSDSPADQPKPCFRIRWCQRSQDFEGVDHKSSSYSSIAMNICRLG